jgi:hypothetical protein
MVQYLCAKNKWQEPTFHDIFWNSHGEALRQLIGQTNAKQLATSEHISFLANAWESTVVPSVKFTQQNNSTLHVMHLCPP